MGLKQGFIINSVGTGKLCKIVDEPSLADFFQRKNSLPLEDRIAISCTLIEGCFRFLGSPWLEQLDAACLKDGTRQSGLWAMLQGSGKYNEAVSQGLQRMKNTADKDSRDITKHCHIFRLGLLLVQLALGKAVSGLEMDKNHTKANVLIKSIQHDAFSSAELLGIVGVETGSSMFGEVMYFCLSSLHAPKPLSDDEVND